MLQPLAIWILEMAAQDKARALMKMIEMVQGALDKNKFCRRLHKLEIFSFQMFLN